jgi:hypothetical protein
MRKSSPSPAKHIGLDPNTGRDAVPRTVRPVAQLPATQSRFQELCNQAVR